jgi:sporulation protein YlmC with PRC-barrel domain
VIRASDLIGCVVQTVSGERIGRVHDLRTRAIEGGWELEGLILGRGGMIARMIGSGPDPLVAGDMIPWEQVTRLDDGLISVRASLDQ